MVITSIIQTIAIYILPLVFAITLHEAAHAYTAAKYGDDTAKALGRLSLNPIKHIDPVGSILFPLFCVIIGAMGGGMFIFGWAKPVPINFSRLQNPKRNLFWIACSGPASNLIQALIWALLLKLSLFLNSYFGKPLSLMSNAGISLNLMLMLLNLIPVLPLDGGRMVFSILPNDKASSYAKIEPYGMLILMVLYFTGVLSFIIIPPLTVLYQAIMLLIQN